MLKSSLKTSLNRLFSTSTIRAMSAPLDASKVKITKNTNPSKPTPNDKLVFGQTFTDHMLTIEWTKEKGWDVPEIKPYGNLSLDPSACVFHYAFELFEGLKAYRTPDNKITMFRPDKNMERMNKSAARICLPTFESEELIKLIGKLIEQDKRCLLYTSRCV